MLLKVASLFAVAILSATLAFSQSFAASLTGSVRDQSGATIPGAIVTAVNVDTNASQTFTTDGTGLYRFPALAPGSYRIEATAAGFKKSVQSGINLRVQQTAQVDITMPVGEAAERVEVSADATQLETATSSIGKVVDNRSIVNLPLNTRNVYSLIFLTPGVAGTIGNSYGRCGIQ